MRRICLILGIILWAVVPYILILHSEGTILFWRSMTRQILFLGKGVGCSGFAFLSFALFLSVRWRWLDRWFGGLDKLYPLHHWIGSIGAVLVAVHPLILASKRAGDFWYWLYHHLFVVHASWEIKVGSIAYWLLMLLLLLIPIRKIPYHWWRRSHRLLDLIYLLAVVHVVGIWNRHPVAWLQLYLVACMAVGGSAILWRLLFPIFRRSYRYRIARYAYVTDRLVKIELECHRRPLKLVPGQYAFFRFALPGVPREWHPFTPIEQNEEGGMTLLVKVQGDYTQSLYRLVQEGMSVEAWGPYGVFDFRAGGERQVWIAGGVGVAPFLAWCCSGVGDRQVRVFFSYRDPQEKKCMDGGRGVEWIPHCTRNEKRLEASTCSQEQAEYFLCGPAEMVHSLRKQLRRLGVPKRHIHWEVFGFYR